MSGSTTEDTEEDSLVHERVTSDDIARVVALVTGIPVQVSIDICTYILVSNADRRMVFIRISCVESEKNCCTWKKRFLNVLLAKTPLSR